MKKFLNDSISVGLSKVLIIVFGLATSIMTARVLGPEKNGLIAALLVYPNIFMSFGSLGIRQSTTYLVGQKKYNDQEIKNSITQIWLFSTILGITICMLIMVNFIAVKHNVFLLVLAISPIPFKLFNTYNSGFFLGKNRIKEFNRINWVPPVSIFCATAIFLLMFDLSLEGYLFALIIGPLGVSIFLMSRDNLLYYLKLKINVKIISKLMSLGLIYAFALLIINLNYKFDIIMLQKMSSMYELGIYSKGANITQFLWQIPMLLSTIVFARSAISKNGREFSVKVAILLRFSFVFITIGSVILWILSDYIIIGMFGIEFSESVSVLNYLLPGVVLLTIYKVMNMDLAGKGKPWISIIAMVPALILNIVLNYYYIPLYGADGSAIASTISYSVAAIIFLFLYSYAVKMPLREIIMYKKNDLILFKQLFKILTKSK
tara:strand:+ start:88672 stop:89970 length:1299 start_codon:yes stop_codon:yes gene_type:complete